MVTNAQHLDCSKEDCSKHMKIHGKGNSPFIPTDIWIQKACDKAWTTNPKLIGEPSNAGFLRNLCCEQDCKYVIKYVNLKGDADWENFQMEVNIQNTVAIMSENKLASEILLLTRSLDQAAVAMVVYSGTVRTYLIGILTHAIISSIDTSSGKVVIGQSINEAIEEIHKLVSLCIDQLTELHKIGFIHGDPHLNNFMFLTEPEKPYPNSVDEIRIIDFGESKKNLKSDDVVSNIRHRFNQAADIHLVLSDMNNILMGMGTVTMVYKELQSILRNNDGLEDELKRKIMSTPLIADNSAKFQITKDEAHALILGCDDTWKLITAVRYFIDQGILGKDVGENVLKILKKYGIDDIDLKEDYVSILERRIKTDDPLDLLEKIISKYEDGLKKTYPDLNTSYFNEFYETMYEVIGF